MRSTLRVLACFLVARLAVGLKGGRPSLVGEHPYLVGIELNNFTWCTGIILDPTSVVLPDDCLRRSPLIEVSSADVVPLVNGDPPKKYKGRFDLSESGQIYSELDVVIIHLEPPGLTLTEPNIPYSGLPSRALISQEKIAPSDAIVVGRRRVAVMTILEDSECFNRIGSLYFPMNDRLQSIKLMLREKLMCAVRNNSTGFIEDIPAGQACPQDLGAPVVQNGSVVGILARNFCPKYYPPVALIRKLESSVLPKGEIPEKYPLKSQKKNVVKRESDAGKINYSAAGNEIPCRESCQAPVRNVSVPDSLQIESKGPRVIAPNVVLSEEILRQERLELDSTEQRSPLVRSDKRRSGNKMNLVQASNVVSANLQEGVSKGLKGVILPEESLIENLVRKKNIRKRYATVEDAVGMNITEAARRIKVELDKVLLLMKEQFKGDSVEHKAKLPRHQRDAPAPAANVTGVDVNATDAEAISSNGTAAENITELADNANATATEVIASNATKPEGPVAGNASVPVTLVIGNETAGKESVEGINGTKPEPEVRLDERGNATGGGNATDGGTVGLAEGGDGGEGDEGEVEGDDESGDEGGHNGDDSDKGVTETGAGTYKDTGEVILSGGDWDLGLERFGGAGNDTSGSGDVGVLSGFGESAQDEIHESEEKLGPPKRPKATVKPPQKTPPPPTPPTKEQEPEAVGPPEPNDDRPDYKPSPGKPAVRHAAFSPRNIPINVSFLISICFVLSHI